MVDLVFVDLDIFVWSLRRKRRSKRVCQVPEEELSSDVWAWKKYGRKPIKDSPYPR